MCLSEAKGMDIIMKKIPLKYVCIISWISWALGIILILLGCWLKLLWLVIAAIFELLAAIVFIAVFNRCPHCGCFLGHSGGCSFCPHCGGPLRGQH